MLFSLFPSPTSSTPSLRLDDADRAALAGFLQKLVQTPSRSTHEGEVAALVRQALAEAGVTDVFTDRAGNVVARLGSGDGPTLLYDAHMDTVAATHADWPHPPLAGVIEGDTLYGLGACDMKGAVAAMVYAARKLVASGTELAGTLVLAFIVQEEPCEGCALKVLVEEEGIRPDWVVLGEPSSLHIMRGHRGRAMFKVTVRGRSSHASAPALGDNAVVAAARLVFGIDLLAADLASDSFLGPGTIAVTHIESEAPSLNAIPDNCTFYVDRRLTLGETATRAQAQIEGVIEREGINAKIELVEYTEASYTGYPFAVREAFNAWAVADDHPLLKAVSAAARRVLGQAPAVGHWTFSTDGVYSMGEADIPTVGFGPGNPKVAHTVQEQISLSEVYRAAEVYAELAASLLSAG